MRHTVGSVWGFRTNWLASRVKKVHKGQLAGKGKDLLEICDRYRFHWQDVCSSEQLNALNIVGSELSAEVVPELQALDMWNEKKIIRFIFPTDEHPDGLRVRYKGEDAAKLIREFGWRKRKRGTNIANSLSAAGTAGTEEPPAKTRKIIAAAAGGKAGAGGKGKKGVLPHQ